MARSTKSAKTSLESTRKKKSASAGHIKAGASATRSTAAVRSTGVRRPRKASVAVNHIKQPSIKASAAEETLLAGYAADVLGVDNSFRELEHDDKLNRSDLIFIALMVTVPLVLGFVVGRFA